MNSTIERYLDNLPWDSLKEMYGDDFGHGIVGAYGILRSRIQRFHPQKIVVSPIEMLTITNDEIVHRQSILLELGEAHVKKGMISQKQNKEIYNALAKMNYICLKIIFERDKTLKQNFKIVPSDNDSFEIIIG